MDVSDWTLAKRMELPDWCFPNRQLISVYLYNDDSGTPKWNISVEALPDPACIWSVGLYFTPDATGKGQLRIGLRDTVPTSIAEMDTATEILPGLGAARDGPDQITFETAAWNRIEIETRFGMVTGGDKLVIQNSRLAGKSRFIVALLVSGLPTNVPRWLTEDNI